MHQDSARILALLVPTAALLLVACGSATSTGGSTTAGTGTAGTGTAGTGTAGTGGMTGTGGSATSASGSTATSTTGGTGGIMMGTGGASATGSTGTGTMMGACTDAADTAAMMANDPKMIAGVCAGLNNHAEPATKDCIKMKSGLTDACVACYDDVVVCAYQNCPTQCGTSMGLGSMACQTCFAPLCIPAFQTCTGITPGG